MSKEARMELRRALAAPSVLIMPGIYDALSAVLAEQAGFGGVFLSGSALAFSQLGRPDIGLLSPTEIALACDRIADRVSIPVFVDADSGYGNTANLQRLVGMLERAGASGLQLEDQEPVKPSDALASRPVISREAMLGKIAAALDARQDANLVVSIRTDAVFTLGFDEALERAALFAEAGADMIFVEGLKRMDDMARLVKAVGGRAPLLHNFLSLKDAPVRSNNELSALGYRVALLPTIGINASAAAMLKSFQMANEQGLEAALANDAEEGFAMAQAIGTAKFLDHHARWGTPTP